jgi:hypothetical protein
MHESVQRQPRVTNLGRMSAQQEHRTFDSGGSFFNKAAWLSLIIPFFVPVIWFCILAITSRIDLPAMVSFFVLLSSLALGVASLFGVRKHGRKRIVWKAVVGIFTSIVLGYFAAAYWSMSYSWHG